MENIVLTGFMGTGKTTVGRLLAERLDWVFVDTDAQIVAADGRPIPLIFAQEGEAYFRQLETAVALELAEKTKQIISTGGRLMLDPVNAAALERNGHVFCLTAAVNEILRRVADDGDRPLLQVPNPEERIRDLLQERAKDYGRFLQIQTDGKMAEQVVEEILEWFSTK